MQRPAVERPAVAPITESDAFLAEALAHASVPALMMSIVHVRGDARLLRGAIRPVSGTMGEVDGGMADADNAAVRRLALAGAAAG